MNQAPHQSKVSLHVSSELWDQAVRHLRDSLPHEGVGLFAVEDRAEGAVAVRFYPGTNVDASPTRFTMDPAEVIASFNDMAQRGTRFGAIVHSHPATEPVPSETDRREAYYPDVVLVIVGLAGPEPVVRTWHPETDGEGRATGFTEGTLRIF